MKCSNPACTCKTFTVVVEHKLVDPEHIDRLPVKLFCSKCKKPVKAWITNAQMKELLTKYGKMVDAYKALVACFENLVDRMSKKPWWKFW